MLTEKEMQVLGLRKKKLRQVQIAARLKISQPAVSAFERNALRKIRDAGEIIDFVKKHGIDNEKE